MFKKSLLATILVGALAMPTIVLAEGNATATEGNSTKTEANSTKSAETSPALINAAKSLLEEMGLETVYKKAVENSTNRLVEANPNFKKIEDKIKAVYEKAIGWKVMKEDLAKLYAKYYNEQELKDITAFYKTKTGKKVLQTMSNLTYEGQLLTRKRLMPHMKELKTILDKAAGLDKKKPSKPAKPAKEEDKTKK